MGKGTAIVKFPDGTLMYGVYNGTSDVLNANLYKTMDDTWEFKNKTDHQIGVPGKNVEPVEIATNYGGGFWWEGEASKEDGLVLVGTQPFGLECWGGEVIISACEIHDGYPDWWPKE